MRSVILAMMTFAVSGCSAVTYSGESSGPVARLRVAAPKWLGNNLVNVWAYEDENCRNERQWFKLNNILLIPSPPMRLGIPLWSYNETAAKEVRVRAEGRLYLLFRGETGSTLCGVPVVAELQPGRDYELVYDEPERGQRCSVVLNEITDGAGGPTKTRIKHFDNVGSEGCEQAFRAFRWF